jgi:hypothetical protein
MNILNSESGKEINFAGLRWRGGGRIENAFAKPGKAV